MRVVLIQATFSPVFSVVDDNGRTVRTFALPEQAWQLHHQDLAGLQARVEAFEARTTAELLAAEEKDVGQRDDTGREATGGGNGAGRPPRRSARGVEPPADSVPRAAASGAGERAETD